MKNLNNPTLGLLSLMFGDDLFKDMNYNEPKPVSFEEAKRIIEERIKDTEAAMKMPKPSIITRHTDEVTLSKLKAYLETKPEVTLYVRVPNGIFTCIYELISVTNTNELEVLEQDGSIIVSPEHSLIVNPYDTGINMKVIDDLSVKEPTINKLTKEYLAKYGEVRCEVFDNLNTQNGNTSVRNIVEYDSVLKVFIDTDGNKWKYAIPIMSHLYN